VLCLTLALMGPLLTAYRPLLAQLHLHRIAEESSKADVEDKITASKTGLLEEYDQSLERITANSGFAKLAFRVFSWLIAARRPLSKGELCQALGIGLEDAKLRRDRIPQFEFVLESCLGLVRFNEPLNTIEFFHFSIKEHLVARNKPEEIAVLNVPRHCLVYLQFTDFISLCQDDASLTLRQQRYPLASYLAEHWTSHVCSDTEVELCDEVSGLLESTNIFSSLQLLPESKRNARLVGTVKDTYSYGTPSKEIAFYLCTYFSLVKVLKIAFDKKLSAAVPVPWGELYSPSHVAVCYGDVPMLQEILMHPRSANCQDRWGLTPLHLAVRLQSTEELALVRALLGSEPDLELQDQDGDTPLHLAASYATVDSIELLLKAGAKVYIQNNSGKTPLHRAIERGSLRVTQLLLDYHADPTTVDIQGRSSLGLCLQDPQLAFLDALSQARDRDGNQYEFDAFEKTVLDGFLQFNEDVVLLEKEKTERLEGERVERERYLRSQYCNTTTTELSWGAEKGAYGSIIRLIRGGADVNKQDPLTGKTPIHHAISNGRVEATFWLADAGASLDIADNNRKTPLDYARGHEEILWELYHAGALSQPPPHTKWRPCRTTGTTWYQSSKRMHLARRWNIGGTHSLSTDGLVSATTNDLKADSESCPI
jgi:ankyrin repeat protein